MTIAAYPLQWPEGWTRSTTRRDATFSKNKRSLSIFDGAERVLDELAQLGLGKVCKTPSPMCLALS